MSTAEFRIDYDPAAFAKLVQQVREMRERAQDLSPAWDALLTWFSEQNFEQFLTRGNRYREPWADLADSTLAYKRKHGFPLDPLIRTGALVQDLTSRPLGFETITPTSVAAGTPIRYAKFHMTGTKKMPRRRMWVPEQIRKEQAATSAVGNWIIRGERQVSGRTEIRGAR